jgi:hypothetical protein
METGDLFPRVKGLRGVKLASPTMDIGDIFSRSKVA